MHEHGLFLKEKLSSSILHRKKIGPGCSECLLCQDLAGWPERRVGVA